MTFPAKMLLNLPWLLLHVKFNGWIIYLMICMKKHIKIDCIC